MIPLAFANVGMLFALAALPVIWYFLRLTPPRPRLERFPPTRLLLRLARKEEQPDHSPWWLTLLRLTIAGLLILALSGPVLRPASEEAPGTGPLLVVIDNGWAAGDHWENMLETARNVVGLARDADRPLALLAAADGTSQELAPTDAAGVGERLAALEPRPWQPDYSRLAERLRDQDLVGRFGGAVILSAGIAAPGTGAFAAALDEVVEGQVIVYVDGARETVTLGAPENTAEALIVPVLRTPDGPATSSLVRAVDIEGRAIGDVPFSLNAGETVGSAIVDLPVELRNEIVRLEIAGSATAGAVQLLDDRWRRRRVGLITGASAERAQPLLSPLYYISRAASPFADLLEPRDANAAVALPELIDAGVSIIAMADVGRLPTEVETTVASWVRTGGTLVRFAGPRLASDADGLVPVQLRNGDRILGGSLSWQTPQRLSGFADHGPFSGLPLPDDVLVTRQVLAEPDGELEGRTWAALEDGTPLVTAAPLGSGLLVLFHVTADTSWSSLPLSGVFVEMLRKIVALSSNLDRGEGAQALPPYRLLDGFGDFGGRLGTARPLAGALESIAASLDHPPGLYGNEQGFRALNLMAGNAPPQRVDPAAFSGRVYAYPATSPVPLAPWLLAAALILFAVDSLVVLWLHGGLALRRRAGVASLVVAVVVFAGATHPVAADEARDLLMLQAANETRLAYVLTGDDQLDDISRTGLTGLSRVIAERTALEPGAPMGVDPATDELAFFPLLYWPVSADVDLPSATTMARIGAFMRQGGSVLFDTRDRLERTTTIGSLGGTPASERLRDMLATLDVPPLEPVPTDHVLTKAFYLLNDFPGRYAGGPLWVEALQNAAQVDRPARAGDGVSTILITSNDLAGAWAIGDDGTFRFPMVPPDRVQREMSLRAGINIVMYALTGNYKADQVHVPALLERLGQ